MLEYIHLPCHKPVIWRYLLGTQANICWEHSGIKVGRPAIPIRFLWDNPTHYCGPWLAYAVFIEGNFPQCGPQYIAVLGGTIPLLVRIMWALPCIPRSFPSIYPTPLLFAYPTPLLFAYPNPLLPYFLGILRERTWECMGVPTLFGLGVGLYPQGQLYIVGRIVGNFPQ